VHVGNYLPIGERSSGRRVDLQPHFGPTRRIVGIFKTFLTSIQESDSEKSGNISDLFRSEE
jgi:hypothetical protein